MNMLSLRLGKLILGVVLPATSFAVQPPTPIDWSQLPEPEAQQYEDPYRDLSQPQFETLMVLARTRLAMDSDLAADERAELAARAVDISRSLENQGLDPEWILDQREAVAARRRHAATATNPVLEGESIQLAGYLLVANEIDEGQRVAYLLPSRGICMHLPPPAPNQLVRLEIDELPEPMGACVAASVRGRLSADESENTVPVLDHVVPLWSRWLLKVSAVSTSRALPAEPNDIQ